MAWLPLTSVTVWAETLIIVKPETVVEMASCGVQNTILIFRTEADVLGLTEPRNFSPALCFSIFVGIHPFGEQIAEIVGP